VKNSIEHKKAIEAIMALHPDWGYVKVSKAIGDKRTGARNYMEKIRGKMIVETNPKKETRNVHSNKIGQHIPKICPICKEDIASMFKYKHIKKVHPEYNLDYKTDAKGNTIIGCGYCSKRFEGYKEFAAHLLHCKQKTTPIASIPELVNNTGSMVVYELFDQLFTKIKRLENKNVELGERLHSENGNSQKLASYVAEAQRLLAKKE